MNERPPTKEVRFELNRLGFTGQARQHRRRLSSSAIEEKLIKLDKEASLRHSVKINDCDNVEVYVKGVVLMYYEDLKAKLRSMGWSS
ncbi:hypothetical protein LR48_Vigan01g082500 [Vigna angularis]|uniref:Uncharacterized protein n=1 Tax=Phaseolus angularis TaxID=3914 RepID=A0A0L9TL44_PHAAN|nr:uncharacterized protein HKW66_Vig0006280 [Vigna angularis]KOM31270.1 hypothetical protein LR48_Vigan01g082500 [Vigna angularis]